MLVKETKGMSGREIFDLCRGTHHNYIIRIDSERRWAGKVIRGEQEHKIPEIG